MPKSMYVFILYLKITNKINNYKCAQWLKPIIPDTHEMEIERWFKAISGKTVMSHHLKK
jgi:hypothetical protein